MAKYLLDTNVILRLSNSSDVQHSLIMEAVSILLARGDECCLVPQVLIELWVVATRPATVNGLGWSVEQTRNVIDQLLNRFPLLDETSLLFAKWMTLVTENKIKGKRTHDARIMAAMLVLGISHILTLNPDDFSDTLDIVPVHPRQVFD